MHTNFLLPLQGCFEILLDRHEKFAIIVLSLCAVGAVLEVNVCIGFITDHFIYIQLVKYYHIHTI